MGGLPQRGNRVRKETEAWRSREGLWLGQCPPGRGGWRRAMRGRGWDAVWLGLEKWIGSGSPKISKYLDLSGGCLYLIKKFFTT